MNPWIRFPDCDQRDITHNAMGIHVCRQALCGSDAAFMAAFTLSRKCADPLVEFFCRQMDVGKTTIHPVAVKAVKLIALNIINESESTFFRNQIPDVWRKDTLIRVVPILYHSALHPTAALFLTGTGDTCASCLHQAGDNA